MMSNFHYKILTVCLCVWLCVFMCLYTAVDLWVFEAPPLGDMRLMALCLISAAFVLLLFPEDWDEKTLQWISSVWSQKTKHMILTD